MAMDLRKARLTAECGSTLDTMNVNDTVVTALFFFGSYNVARAYPVHFLRVFLSPRC